MCTPFILDVFMDVCDRTTIYSHARARHTRLATTRPVYVMVMAGWAIARYRIPHSAQLMRYICAMHARLVNATIEHAGRPLKREVQCSEPLKRQQRERDREV